MSQRCRSAATAAVVTTHQGALLTSREFSPLCSSHTRAASRHVKVVAAMCVQGVHAPAPGTVRHSLADGCALSRPSLPMSMSEMSSVGTSHHGANAARLLCG